MLRFIEQTQVTFPIGWDDDRSYGQFRWPGSVSPFPRQALIGKDGVVKYIAAEYDQVALEAAIVAALAE